MEYLGQKALEKAEWLLGFDFDGTLADINNNHSVHSEFFKTISSLQEEQRIAWGICTGRSLDFILTGMKNASFPFWPDYLVTQERDIFYHDKNGNYMPDEVRNNDAKHHLIKTLEANKTVINKISRFVRKETKGQWIETPSDPAGIIAHSEEEIQQVVDLFHETQGKTGNIDYQRNTIYLRFTHKDYCKGTAVIFLRNEYNISHRNTLVMGDNYNDLTMLNSKVAAHYGGPANSLPALRKALANTGGFITKEENALGVVEALRKHL